MDVRHGLDEGSSLYPTGNYLPNEPQKNRFAVVNSAEIPDGSQVRVVYPDAYETLWCKPLPESMRVNYHYRKADTEWATVAVRSKAPADFYQSPVRGVRVVVDSREQPYVEFYMRLSELTAKWLTHTETAAEKQQRALDEALWLALDADMSQPANRDRVQTLLVQGARTVQPWMDATWNISYPNSVLRKALRTDNAAVVDMVLQHGGHTMWLFEDIGASQLNLLILAKRYDLLDVFLKNGVNPNFYDRVAEGIVYGAWTYRYPNASPIKTSYYERPLVIALMHQDSHAVQQLLRYGADLNFRLNKHGPYGAIEFSEFLQHHVSEPMRALVSKHRTTPNLAGVKKPDGYAHPNPNLRTENQLMLESYELPKPFVPYQR